MHTQKSTTFFAAVLLGWIANPIVLADVSVNLQAIQPIETECRVTALHLTMEDGSQREQQLTPPLRIGSATAAVRMPSGAERVAFAAEGCWIDTIPLPPAGSAHADAWPLARLVARLPEGKEAGSVHAVFLDSTATNDDSRQQINCALIQSNVACAIPAARRLHLRLEWGDSAPTFKTNLVAADGGEVDLGRVEFASAYAVTGAVTRAGGAPIARAGVRLVPVGAADMAASERIVQTYVSVTDQRGRYRITNVPPGLYRLVSRVSGFSDVVVPSLEISGDITAPGLIHQNLATIELLIDPPAAPDGTPWRVTITRAGMRQGEIMEVEESNANPAGVWESKPLPAGEYTVRVSNQVRSEVAVEQVVLAGRQERRTVKLSGIVVRGRLVDNDEGVSGEIEFTEISGQPTLRTAAGEDGSFSVTFPAPGSWRVRLSVGSSRTALRLAPILIRDDTTEIELRLPAGRVSGRVLSSDRKPADAFVAARRDGRIVAETRTDQEGAFTLENLAEGDYSLEANSDSGFAPSKDIEITADSADVELILAPVRDVRGVVLRSEGRPLSGAVVRVFDYATHSFHDTIADPEGYFSLPLRSLGAIDVIVIAPPFPITPRSFLPPDWQGKTVTVVVRDERAILRIASTRVPPWPTLISANGTSRSLGLFMRPQFGGGPPPEFVNGAFEFIVEPGSYRLCNETDCRAITLPTGAEVLVSFVPTQEKP